MKPPRKRYPKGTWMKLKSGALLRELMNTKRVSNADVGMAAGCGRTFISALVNERRTSCTPKVAEYIAARLEVPVEVLFDRRASAASVNIDKRKANVA